MTRERTLHAKIERVLAVQSLPFGAGRTTASHFHSRFANNRLPWPAERAANDYDHARPVYLSASVDHRRLTDAVWVAEARANSRVLHLASKLVGQIIAVQAAERHAEPLVFGQHARIAVKQVLCNGRGHGKQRHACTECCRKHRCNGFHGETSWSPQ